MAQTEKVICYMRNGYAQSFGRLPGAPKIPAKPAVVELQPAAAKYLRAMGTAFIELTQKQFDTFEADQKAWAEARAKKRAEREAKQKDVGPKPKKKSAPKADVKPSERARRGDR